MRKINVSGPSIEEIAEIFTKSLIYENSAKVELKKDNTVFEVIIDIIDATIWHLPQSVFNDDESLKKVLIVKGWLNREYNKKLDSTITKKCIVEMFSTGEILLKIK